MRQVSYHFIKKVGKRMLKVTSQAISQIKKEIEPYIKDGKEQFVRLYMSVG